MEQLTCGNACVYLDVSNAAGLSLFSILFSVRGNILRIRIPSIYLVSYVVSIETMIFLEALKIKISFPTPVS